MGTEIHGYIQVNPFEDKEDESWVKIVDLFIAERNYEIFAELFGNRSKVSNHAFKGRGLPENCNQQMIDFFIDESLADVTWVLYSEIKDLMNKFDLTHCPGWELLFLNVIKLADMYDENRVRFVVAFDNYG